MNLIDVLIIVLAIGALIRGQELGFVRQLFSTAGFFIGLLIGAAWLEPNVINHVHSQTYRLIVAVLSTLGLALVFLSIGELAGIKLKQRVWLSKGLNHVDNSFGAGLAAATILAIVWLAAAILVTLPYPNVQSSIRGSGIIGLLDKNLPAAPNVIADISHLIAPNGFPKVFIGPEPSPTKASLPTPAALVAAVNKDRASVVKVEGQGCGGIVEGSGFVISSDLVVTDAHVIAGIYTPYVIDGNGTHQATPIWFDPNLDLAVLRVPNLAGGALTFDTNTISHGTPGGVLGYPGGGPFVADTAAVLDEFTAVGRNIYDQGTTERDVYSVKANVIPGNSGGPLVNLDGQVMGIVFAASTQYNDLGYALSNSQVIHEIDQARAMNQTVGTGSCAEE
ncbi:MAG: MarP family serine protease [Candidatus Saccharimonadales bacterium]